jgi:hypothetical protein
MIKALATTIFVLFTIVGLPFALGQATFKLIEENIK